MALSKFRVGDINLQADSLAQQDIIKEAFIKVNQAVIKHYEFLQELKIQSLLSSSSSSSKKDKMRDQLKFTILRSVVNQDEDNKRESPLKHFPVEIWNIILLKLLSNEMDAFHFSCTCRLFQSLYSSKRTKMLFPKVYEILQPHLNGYGSTDVLVLRTACKEWNSVIDKSFQNHLALIAIGIGRDGDIGRPPPPPRFYRSESLMLGNGMTLVYCFSNQITTYQEPGYLLRHLQASHQKTDNPFISRALQIRLFPVSNVEVSYDERAGNQPGICERDAIFWEKLILLLEKFGPQIYSLHLHITKYYPQADMGRIINFIRCELSVLLPNLKFLRMSGHLPIYPAQYIWHHQVALPSLDTFLYELDEHTQQLFGHIEDIMEYDAKQAGRTETSTLKILMHNWKAWDKWGIYSRDWSNLVELYLVDIGNEMLPDKLASAHLPNLEKLGLTPSNVRDFAEGYTLPAIFEIVSSLSRNTRMNTLKIREGFPTSQIKGAKMCVQTLTNLEIEHITGQNFLDAGRYNFLLRMPFIENLRLYWIKPDMDQERWNMFAKGEPDPKSLLDITDLVKCMKAGMNALCGRSSLV